MTGAISAGMSERRVLVTGAGGFLGRQTIAPLLARGYEVHAVGRGSAPEVEQLHADGVRWHAGDLLDATAAEDLTREIAPTHLLHFAWYAEHGRFWDSQENVRWLEASLRLLRAFAAGGGRRAVLAGTCAEYDWSVAGRLKEGVTPLAPATLYGQCKQALHQVAESMWASSDSPTLAWGRIFFLYGPHEQSTRLVASVIGALLKGEIAPCSHGLQERDFLHVADVAGAFVALLDSPVGGAVNIGSGENVRIADVVAMVAEICGRRDLLRLGALPARPGEPHELVADVARLGAEVGFVPARTLEQGIRETVAWWRGQLDQPA
jgi:nucleoside-diphosphate-sugar epimerase